VSIFNKDGSISDSACNRAIQIAGAISATVSRNGVIQGVNEWIVALCSIRMTHAVYEMAQIIEEHPELLSGEMEPTLARAEVLVREFRAAQAAQAAEAAEAKSRKSADKEPANPSADPSALSFSAPQ
jgi:hypothetical protein